MKRNRFCLSVMLAVTAILVGCSSNQTNFTSTGSMIEVISKEYTDKDEAAWIVAFDPNNHAKEDTIEIHIEETMVWNLIEEGNVYFDVYTQQGDDTWVLKQMSHENDNHALR